MSESDNLDRRTFAKQCLGGIGTATVLAGSTAGQDQIPPAQAESQPKPAEDRTSSAELLILSTLVQNYPSENYTEEIYRNIYREILGDAARGKQLRAFPLHNSDEPACVFRVFRTVEGTP